jgi:hypothetical protein
MPKFQLYKQRKFNDFLNDTTQFFRLFGGDYLKKYVLINGGIILLMCVLFYFATKYFMVSESLSGRLMQDFASGIGEGWGTVLVFALVTLAVGLAYVVFSFGFPNAYFDNLAENGSSEKISPSDILKGIGHVAGDVLLFLVISLFTFFPLYILLAIVSGFLMPFVVGYFILAIGGCFLLSWCNLSLIVYVRDHYAGYFDSFAKGWKILVSSFKHIVGANMVLCLILYLFQMLVTLLPTVVAAVFFITSGKSSFSESFPILLDFVYIFVIISVSVLTNVFFVQQYLIYFSSVEKEENIQAISELDSIGQHED